MPIHNKLVRDKIPEIIENTGKKAYCRILTEEEYLSELDKKLNWTIVNKVDKQNDKIYRKFISA